jgi:hypothetical protein
MLLNGFCPSLMLLRPVRLALDPTHVPKFSEIFAQGQAHIRQQPGGQHLELWPDAAVPHIYGTNSH